MKQVLREEGLDAKGETRPAAILGAISRAKNDMLDPKEIPPLRLATGVTVQIARLARLYRRPCEKANALDFDDLLLEAVRLFDEAPQTLARYQDRWRYLHVDEYQDTNRPQYLWIKALASKHRQPRGRRRRRPVDLRLARRGHPEHPRLRARLAQGRP